MPQGLATDPLPFIEALSRLDVSKVVPSTLGHAELLGIASEIRERTFTAARVANAETLQALRTTVRDVIDRKITEQQGRKLMLDQDLLPSRIDLIIQTQASMARGYGQWKQSQNKDVLRLFPAQEFFRAEQRMEPRDWPQRWEDAGGEFFDGPSDYPQGRMVALRNDPIWEAISAFGLPYFPFDFNSGMRTRPIEQDEAKELGLLKSEEDIPEPEDREFEDDAEFETSELDDDLKESLLESIGSGYVIRKGVLTHA